MVSLKILQNSSRAVLVLLVLIVTIDIALSTTTND